VTPASTDDVRDPTTWSVEDLLAAKHRGGHHVTVVIPARDEESTVGSVVKVVRGAWVDEVPLVDELVVIDSDSVDATAERARSAGAIVHRACDIRPDLGPAQGKGEALWKALHVTTGDALLGPLLLEPGIQLVKAVYHRPLLDATGREAETGGRVTELVARPLLALNAPELAHIIQPLSGEWAIRAHRT
jgi:glucosyl-3-phosphoglycerate synthase